MVVVDARPTRPAVKCEVYIRHCIPKLLLEYLLVNLIGALNNLLGSLPRVRKNSLSYIRLLLIRSIQGLLLGNKILANTKPKPSWHLYHCFPLSLIPVCFSYISMLFVTLAAVINSSNIALAN